MDAPFFLWFSVKYEHYWFLSVLTTLKAEAGLKYLEVKIWSNKEGSIDGKAWKQTMGRRADAQVADTTDTDWLKESNKTLSGEINTRCSHFSN